MMRAKDWIQRLHAEIEGSRKLPFAWGSFDCALFACNCVLTMTGVDPAADFRGKYHDEAGVEALFQANGGSLETLAAGVAAKIGLPEIRPALGFAGRGDLVLVDNAIDGSFSRALGVVGMNGPIALCASEKGLARIHARRWIRGWKV